MRYTLSLFLLLLPFLSQAQTNSVSSPDKKIKVVLTTTNNAVSFTTFYNNAQVLEKAALGLKLEDESFVDNLQFVSAAPAVLVQDHYKTLNAKKSSINYKASKRIFRFKNTSGKKIDIIFQVSNDAVAFRYYFPDKSGEVKKIIEEATAYTFDAATKAWLQPMSVAKTGWEKSNPSYEEHYKQDISVGTPSKAGWVYPALFKSNNTWLLFTESSLDSSFCATKLVNDSASNIYKVSFPDPREIFTGRGLVPQSTLPWYSPWRIIAIGSLKTIVESTAGTDLAKPAISMDASFVKPGKASWSWINSKDDFIVYDEQKKYIDYAADMKWQYCLIDVNWDTKIGYEKIKELADYGKTKNVGLILWYNSAGDWNTTPYHPKSMLLTHEQRVSEFGKLQSMGIKGVKIDFFGGDGQSMIKYYHDILIDAAKYKLLVNFHGATLPRGWQRTYPHLVTTEAIKGFEMVTFGQGDADLEANHCTMAPFTRNAFDPMDFTPMNLYKINARVKRKTTSAFELALSVLFLSGIQHYAESPEGMTHVPEFAKNFLRTLPNYWDDVKFIDGFPGKFVVVARRSGTKWYIAAINGELSEKNIAIDLSQFKKTKSKIIADAEGDAMFKEESLPATSKQNISMKGNGGFVIVLE